MNDLVTLKKATEELIEKLIEKSEFEARRVGVSVFNFVGEQKMQEQLTDFAANESERA